jgi:carbon-monoxide dehydrogenase medium subunit
VLQNGELLVSLKIPAPAAGFGACYLRFIPRNEMDIAVVGVGSSVVLSADGSTITSARVALGAVGPTPITVDTSALAGQPANETTINTAAEASIAAASPMSDMRGTVAQRRHLSGVLTRRTLQKAIARAQGEA